MLAQERMGQGEERLGIEAGRLAQGDRRQQALGDYRGWKENQQETMAKVANLKNVLQSKNAVLAAKLRDPSAKPEERQKALEEIQKNNQEYQENSDKLLKGGGEEASPVEGAGTETDPVKVKTPQDAQKLPPGTIYATPDGQVMVR